MISCILQHDEIILMLSWSTMRTRQSPSFFDAWMTSVIISVKDDEMPISKLSVSMCSIRKKKSFIIIDMIAHIK